MILELIYISNGFLMGETVQAGSEVLNVFIYRCERVRGS